MRTLTPLLKPVCSAAAFSRRDGAEQQREEPVFAANIPLKVALFAAFTGHEYQAEGAEGAVDSPPRSSSQPQTQFMSQHVTCSCRHCFIESGVHGVLVPAEELHCCFRSFFKRFKCFLVFPFFFLSYTCLKHLNECAFV